MKICIVTETFPPEINGVAMTLKRLARILAQRGHEVEVVRPRQKGEPLGISNGRLESSESFEQYTVRGVPIPQYPEAQIGLPWPGELSEHWLDETPDVIHVATEGVLGFSGIRNARELEIPLVTSFHTNFHEYTKHYGVGLMKGIVEGYLRFIHNHARCNLTPDQGLIEDLKGLGFENPVYFGRGVDTDLFQPERRDESLRQEWGAGPNDPVLVHVSRVAAEKNIPVVVEGFRRIQKKLPAAKLVIVGDGPWLKFLQRNNPDLIYVGMREDEDLARHYASADLFPFASVTETFGNVVMEALASGLPVITYDYAAGHQFIKDGVNGFMEELGEDAAFVDRMEAVALDLSNLDSVRAKARETALQVPWSSVVADYEKTLEEHLS